METVEQILESDDPVRVFGYLKRRSVHGTEDKIKMLGDLIKVWEFFAVEKKAGRLYYRPLDPGDMKGITRKIEVHGTRKAYSIQFNTRTLEHTFSVEFKGSDIPMEKVVRYLNRELKVNKLVHERWKDRGFGM